MSLEQRVCSALPSVSPEEVASAANGPTDAATHSAWFDRLECMHHVEVTEAGGPPAPFDAGRVVGWNVERGRDTSALAALIARERAELVLLSEVDVGMARSGNHHTPREIARHLGFGCAYAVEFLELGLGGPEERRAHAGEENASGFHGGAILSASPLERPAVCRLESRGTWFDGARGERRIGGRIAVLATWRCRGNPVTVAAVHLESHSDPADRCAQIRVLLDDVEAYQPGAPALIAGDLNTFSMGLSEMRDGETLDRALVEDGIRLKRPTPHEPLFALARERGYAWELCNVKDEPTHRVAKSDDESARGGLKLDWFLSRGLGCSEPRVVEAVGPGGGRALSDHEAISVRVDA